MEPDILLETDEFASVLNDIGDIVSDGFTEDETQMVFLNEGYFHRLGYNRIGTDIKSEISVGNRRVDYITTGHGESVGDTITTVYEFKKPSRILTKDKHIEQLFECMKNTGSMFGVLTNGQRFMLYQEKASGPTKQLDFYLESATGEEASMIITCLGYWSIQEQNIKPVAEKTAKEVVESIPKELHIEFSEAGIELFSEHLARYLQQEFKRNSL